MRRKGAAVAALAAALLLALPLSAAEGQSFPRPPEGVLDLRFIGESAAGEYNFVELTTMHGARTALTVWVLQIFLPPMENPVADLGARWTRWIYNCDVASAEPDSDAYLDTSYVLFGGVVPTPGAIILPQGSIGYATLDAACNGQFPYPNGRSFANVAEAVTIAQTIGALPAP